MQHQQRVQKLKRFYQANKTYFGKRVLDLACGGGILGFILEQHHHQYTGIDINKDMIHNARAHAKATHSQNTFILADITKKNIRQRFDTITLIGNSLGHINTHEFFCVLQNIPPAQYFVVDYRDVVQLLFDKKWQHKMKEKRKKTFISTTIKMNPNEGNIYKKAQTLQGKKILTFTHAIWSPFIIEPLMHTFGWTLVKRRKNKSWQGWTDIYKK